jgi:ABC-2 type transport system permease protein
MIALLGAEWLKLRSTRTPFIMGIVLLVCVVVPLVLALALVPRDWLESDGIGAFLSTASAIVPLALLTLGILGMTNEYRHGTITYSYLVTPRRWQVMVVKLVVYGAVGIVTMLAAVLLVFVIIKVGGSLRGVPIDPASGSTAADYARQIVTAGLITTFGVALGALFRAQVATVAATLIWALVVENIIAAVKPAVGVWLPFTVFSQVSAVQTGTEGNGVAGMADQLSRPTAFAASLVYIGAVSVAAVLISLRRDVT